MLKWRLIAHIFHKEVVEGLRGQVLKLAGQKNARNEVLRLLKQTGLHGMVVSRHSGAGYNVGYYYDDSDLASLAARRSSWALLEKVQQSARDARLEKYGVSLEDLYPVQLHSTSVTDAQAFATKHTGSVLSYLMLVFLCMLAYYPALNATVGERERGTLATLMTTPARARELVLGKYFGVVFFCAAGIMMYALEPALSALWFAPKFALRPLPNSWWQLVLPVSATIALVAALTICVGLIARRVTEGQAFLSLTMMFLLFPTVAAGLSDAQLTNTSALIPFFNTSLVMKYFMQNSLPQAPLLITAAVNFLLSLGMVTFAVNSLEGEYLAQPGVSDVLSLDRRILRRSNPALGLILFLFVIGASFYLNMILREQSIFLLIALTHVGVMFVLPWLAYRYFNLKWADAIPHAKAPASVYAGALLAALAMAVLMIALLPQSPLSKEMAEELARRFEGLGQSATGMLLMLLVLAILPGIFEELAFRGYLFTSLARGFSGVWTVVLTSLMFGANHFSLIRMLPTTLIGLVLGTVAWRTRSIFPTILFHVVYNSAVILVAGPIDGADGLPRYAVWAAAVVFALGFALLTQPWKRKTPESRLETPAPLRIAE
ncbi:MAG: CPBP family intramembrane metalloprotease [Deltaproteobacteria bacterium]|nr:CPBP family intramembrane metalloprotease [Deltaproteobacteria bacterium]